MVWISHDIQGLLRETRVSIFAVVMLVELEDDAAWKVAESGMDSARCGTDFHLPSSLALIS
jgi:hypothetical protein